VTIDAVKLLLVESSKDLAQGGFSTACFSYQKNRLLSAQALVDKNRQSN
jgi:hypothetical protein